MNKLLKVILIVLILLFSINVFSSDFTYGVKIGGTYSNADSRYETEGIISSHYDNNDYYWGTFFSFYGYTNINKIIDLQFEGNINQRGFLTQSDTGVTIQALELVSLLKLNLNKNIIPYLGGVASLSIYTGESRKYGATDFNIDFGFTLGVEFKFDKYLIDLRFNKGFGNFFESVRSNSTSWFDNSRQFILSLGYEF
jgi:hypothetical protein